MKEMTLFGETRNHDMLTLYHGSNFKIIKPLKDYGRSDNDYGQGFYTTMIKDKAVSWAQNMGSSSDAVVNTYELDVSGLKVVNLNDFGVLAWIAEIAANRPIKSELSDDFLPEFVRKYRPDTLKADVLVGYRADDSYTDVIAAFVDGLLNCDEVERLFYKGNLGEQYFIKSQKAFDALQFVCAENVNYVNMNEQIVLEAKARQEVFEFIEQRRTAIARRFFVPPITIIDAIESDYAYNTEYDFYEKVVSKNETL